MLSLGLIGRTGRFGRQGISVNFVHDKRSWDEMAFIEKTIQRDIQRIKTENFEDMERVSMHFDDTMAGYHFAFIGFKEDYEG